MPYCANCGASSDQAVETCANCAGAAALSGDKAPSSVPVARPSTSGRLFAGFLAAVGGLIGGTTFSTFLFWFVAGAGGLNSTGDHTLTKVFAIALVILGLVGFVALVRTGKKRDLFLQVFLVSTLATALGVFATCSSLFWVLKN